VATICRQARSHAFDTNNDQLFNPLIFITFSICLSGFLKKIPGREENIFIESLKVLNNKRL